MIVALIYSDTLLKKINDFGVRVYCWRKGVPYEETPNHVEVIIDGETYGAVPKTVRKERFAKYVDSISDSLIRYELVDIPCTREEEEDVQMFLESMIGTRYEYLMVISHFFRIVFGFWLGRRRKKAVTCVELAIRALNRVKGYDMDVTMNMYDFKKRVKGRCK